MTEPLLRLLHVPAPIPEGHTELDVATLPADVVQRGRGVNQATVTTPHLPLLRCLTRYLGVRSAAESAERLRRLELNLLWCALDRDGIPGLGWAADLPAVAPWSLDHPAFWGREFTGEGLFTSGEIMATCDRLGAAGELQRGRDWLLHLTPEGRRRLAAAGGQALLDAAGAYPKDARGKALPRSPSPRASEDERRAFHRTTGALWDAWSRGKQEAARRTRCDQAWNAD